MNKRGKLIEKFHKEVFLHEDKIFQEAIDVKIRSENRTYMEELCACVKRFLKEIAQLQKTIFHKIGCIEISFLRASVDSSNLLVALEAYDERQDVGKCLIDMRSSFRWFAEEWTTFKDRLNNIREKEEWCRYISQEDIRVMLQETYLQLLVKMVYLFKYTFQFLDTWEEYKAIRNTDFFYLSMGEFRDNQKILFVDRAEFDIFLCGVSDPLCYGKFGGKTYKNKVFGNLDLKGSKFINCSFERCDFNNMKFNDSFFFNCHFFKCKFCKTDLSGSVFEDCIFDECDLEELDWYIPFDIADKEQKEVYRTTEIKQCNILRTYLKKNKLDMCRIVNLKMEDIIERGN